jgi:hypothetical protein
MMAKGHSTSTLCAAALVLTAGSAVHLVVALDPKIILIGALCVMAGSLRPDIDHHMSTATHVWGAVSVIECWFWRFLARGYYERTRLEHEPPDADPHRHLTHSPVPGCIALGLWEALWLSGAPARLLAWSLAFHWPSLALSADSFARCGTALALGMTAGLALAPWSWKGRWLALGAGALLGFSLTITPGLLAFVVVCVWFGCVCHCLGDCVTEGGAPLRHPLITTVEKVKTTGRIGNRYATVETHRGRWTMVGPPRILRFPTGGIREKIFLFLLVCVTAYVMVLVFLPGLPGPGPT